MRKHVCAIILILGALNCGGGSSSGGDTGYILQPGSLTTTTMTENFNINYNGARTGNFAVIYRGTIGGVTYIGITVDDDGDITDNVFNFKLYYQGSDIPFGSSKTLTSGSEGFSVKIVDSGGTHSTIDGGDPSIKLNFSTLNSTDNTVDITADDTLGVGGSTLTINSIKAYYYNASQ